MKKKIWFGSLIFLLLLITAGFVWRSHPKGQEYEIKVTAHRGNSVGAPENTIPAIEQAIVAGADCVEIDVRQTVDGILVLLHDESLLRTTGIRQSVSTISSASLEKADAGGWFGYQYQDTRIPSLEEVLIKTKGKIKLNIELKDCGSEAGIAGQVVSLIEKYNMESECSVSSVRYDYLQQVKGISAGIQTGLIINSRVPLSDYGTVDFFSVNYRILDQIMADEIHSEGKELHVWTVNSRTVINEICGMHVDNIITNDPSMVRRYCEKKLQN